MTRLPAAVSTCSGPRPCCSAARGTSWPSAPRRRASDLRRQAHRVVCCTGVEYPGTYAVSGIGLDHAGEVVDGELVGVGPAGCRRLCAPLRPARCWHSGEPFHEPPAGNACFEAAVDHQIGPDGGAACRSARCRCWRCRARRGNGCTHHACRSMGARLPPAVGVPQPAVGGKSTVTTGGLVQAVQMDRDAARRRCCLSRSSPRTCPSRRWNSHALESDPVAVIGICDHVAETTPRAFVVVTRPPASCRTRCPCQPGGTYSGHGAGVAATADVAAASSRTPDASCRRNAPDRHWGATCCPGGDPSASRRPTDG